MTLLGFATLTPGILGEGVYDWQSLSLRVGGVLLGSGGLASWRLRSAPSAYPG